jgi:hypothetical protein
MMAESRARTLPAIAVQRTSMPERREKRPVHPLTVSTLQFGFNFHANYENNKQLTFEFSRRPH